MVGGGGHARCAESGVESFPTHYLVSISTRSTTSFLFFRFSLILRTDANEKTIIIVCSMEYFPLLYGEGYETVGVLGIDSCSGGEVYVIPP